MWAPPETQTISRRCENSPHTFLSMIFFYGEGVKDVKFIPWLPSDIKELRMCISAAIQSVTPYIMKKMCNASISFVLLESNTYNSVEIKILSVIYFNSRWTTKLYIFYFLLISYDVRLCKSNQNMNLWIVGTYMYFKAAIYLKINQKNWSFFNIR